MTVGKTILVATFLTVVFLSLLANATLKMTSIIYVEKGMMEPLR